MTVGELKKKKCLQNVVEWNTQVRVPQNCTQVQDLSKCT